MHNFNATFIGQCSSTIWIGLFPLSDIGYSNFSSSPCVPLGPGGPDGPRSPGKIKNMAQYEEPEYFLTNSDCLTNSSYPVKELTEV